MTQNENKTIQILARIDKNTKSILDAFASGITAAIIKPSEKPSLQRNSRNSTQSSGRKDKPTAISVTVEINGNPVHKDNKKIPSVLRQPKIDIHAAVPESPTYENVAKPIPSAFVPHPETNPFVTEPVTPSGESTPNSPVIKAPASEKKPKSKGHPIPDIFSTDQLSIGTNRDTKGRFKPKSKSQEAFDDKKRKDASPGYGSTSSDDEKAKSLLSRLLSAGVEATKNADVKEVAGLAVLGPVSGAVSELSGLGSSIKDTFSNIKDKLTGGGSKTGDKAADAQVEATGEVKAAIDESETHAEDRHHEIIKALKNKASGWKEQAQSGPSILPGKPKKRGILSRAASALTGGGSGGGGIMSGITGLFSGGIMRMILPALLGAGGVAAIAAVVTGFFDKKTTGQPGSDGNEKGGSGLDLGAAITKAINFGQEAEKSMTEALMNVLRGGGDIPTQVQASRLPGDTPKTYMRDPSRAELLDTEKSNQEAVQNKYQDYLHPEKHRAYLPNTHGDFGWLATQFESGGDPGAISPKDKTGKRSYGVGQMREGGTLENFIKNSKYKDVFEGLTPGTSDFNIKWKDEAAKDPSGFRKEQIESLKKTHYAPMAEAAAGIGLDPTNNKALQETLFATGLQHGQAGGPLVLKNAFKGKTPEEVSQMSVEDQIRAIGKERGAKDGKSGPLSYFKTFTHPEEHASVLDRINRETEAAVAASKRPDNIYAGTPAQKDATTLYNAAGGPYIPEKGIDTHPDTMEPLSSASFLGSKKAGGILAPAIAGVFDATAWALSPFTPKEGTQPATPIQAPEPYRAPIIPQKPEPQPVTIAGGDTQDAAGQLARPEFNRQIQRQVPNQQPKPAEANIKMDFDDAILTLLIYDRM